MILGSVKGVVPSELNNSHSVIAQFDDGDENYSLWDVIS